jgi:site-specific recombinase XerD
LQQQNVSRCTLLSYRDAMRLLPCFLAKRRRCEITALTQSDIDVDSILAFLTHLEGERGNSSRTRNVRLAAIRAYVRFASAKDPTQLPMARRILAIPSKRHHKPALGYLTQEEMEAVIDAPDGTQWSGRRDRILFAFLYNTGARVSEAITCRRSDADLAGSRIKLQGKGRKERTIPLWSKTVLALRIWMRETSESGDSPLFPNNRGETMSRSGVENRLACAVESAGRVCPTLQKKHVSPHTIRHTTAMHLLQAGVELSVIALWLGHESTETTHKYLEADITLKQEALAKTKGVKIAKCRYRPDKSLLKFLDNL